MTDNSNSQQKKKKPWEKELANIFLIILGLMLLNTQPLVFDPIGYFRLFFLINAILGMIFGCFCIWIGIKYWRDLPKTEQIAYSLGGLGLILIGVIISQMPLPEFPEVVVMFAMFYSLFISGVAGLYFIINGVYILYKNYQSTITRFFFFSFTVQGFAWFFYIYYFISYFFFWGKEGENVQSGISVQATQLNNFNYCIFYSLLFLGVVLLTQACRALIPHPTPQSQRIVDSSMILSFICAILLILIQREVGLAHTLLFTVLYLVSLLVPIGYSIYRLSFYPNWLTSERRRWIKRIRIGILLLIPYPLTETIIGLIPFHHFFFESLSAANPVPRFMPIISVAIVITCYAVFMILSGSPNVSKWFFEEIKFRATPDLIELNPNIDLATIWEQVDEWEKKSELTSKEMTTQKLEEYVQAAKSLLMKEGVFATNV